MKRLLAIALLMLCLAPGTWFRTKPAPPDFTQKISVAPLKDALPVSGEITPLGAWHITSDNDHFGSYSSLLAMDDGTFLAASDRGKLLRLVIPSDDIQRRTMEAEIGAIGDADPLKKQLVDLESMTRDPATGQIWAGYEGVNAIERMDSALNADKRVRPKPMQEWASNSGPEAMVRLADGRFVVISEGKSDWGETAHPALLFPSDPVEGAKAQRFVFSSPKGFRPVDMAQIPDGRVLIIVRAVRFGIPPRFAVKLVVADPADISEGGVWQGREIATIDDRAISDNYEGIAIIPGEDGLLDVWLISDDNNALVQRTLLLKLSWGPAAQKPD